MFKYILCMLLFSSVPLFAYAEDFDIVFEFENASQEDFKLLNTLQDHAIFKKLQDFSDKNLQLKSAVNYTLHQGSEPFFGASQNRIFIPYSFLHKIYGDLQFKYPQQPALSDKLFAFTVEKLLWLEFGRVLISQYSLAVSGREEFTLDNFSTLMLLNISDLDSEYLLDATEEFLLMDDASSLMSKLSFQSESELDELRYRLVVCMVLGKDNENHIKLLEELAWDKERLMHCREHYREKMTTWYEALLPYLKEENNLKQWLELFPKPLAKKVQTFKEQGQKLKPE